MQPYFFPYIGYFQLMNIVDEFIIYDNIQYTKKSWINRNRILINGRDSYFTIPLKKDSDFLDIRDRVLSETWNREKFKMLNRIREIYRKAHHFESVFPLIERSLSYSDTNLFKFILHSLQEVRTYLEIETPLRISSHVPVNHSLKAEKRVLAICKQRNVKTYINPIGGIDLYSRAEFRKEGIELFFLKSNNLEYRQFSNNFVPSLSIIDVLMFNPRQLVIDFLKHNYELV